VSTATQNTRAGLTPTEFGKPTGYGPVYLPATKRRPAEPAPPLLTERETLRLLRMTGTKDGYQVLYRLRQHGLVSVKIGNRVLYLLSDVLEYLRQRRDHASLFASKNASKDKQDLKDAI
jgi:hypothetical protein